MERFDFIADPELRDRLNRMEQRGAFQGWIGDYAVYQKDGATYGYHRDNKSAEPDYTGSEAALYSFAGVKPSIVYRRF